MFNIRGNIAQKNQALQTCYKNKTLSYMCMIINNTLFDQACPPVSRLVLEQISFVG